MFSGKGTSLYKVLDNRALEYAPQLFHMAKIANITTQASDNIKVISLDWLEFGAKGEVATNDKYTVTTRRVNTDSGYKRGGTILW
jgi:hypothetical protein